MTKRFLVETERDGKTQIFAVTVSRVAPKDLRKLSPRMARKLLKGEKLSKVRIEPLFFSETEE